jgi:hypothetical protein
MSTERTQEHHGKTPEERRAYQTSYIREQGPTLEDRARKPDATDVPVEVPEGEHGALQRTKSESRLTRLLKEEPAKLIIVPVALGILAWAGLSLYSLNREVGELESAVIGVESSLSHLREDVAGTSDRMDREIGRLTDDLRSLRARVDVSLDQR